MNTQTVRRLINVLAGAVGCVQARNKAHRMNRTLPPPMSNQIKREIFRKFEGMC